MIVGGEWVGRGAEDGYVVSGVGGDYGDLQEAGRAIGAVHEDKGLAAVAEGFKDVGGGEQVALLVDKKGVTEEDVVVAMGGGGLIETVHDGADGGNGVGLRNGDGGRGCDQEAQGYRDAGDGHGGQVTRGEARGKGGKGTGVTVRAAGLPGPRPNTGSLRFGRP